MSTMVERVARASFACWRKRMDEKGLLLDRGRNFEDMDESEREFAPIHARAVIEAMREPTAAMIRAGDASGGAPTGKPVNFPVTENVWQAMVNEALK